MSPGYVSSPAAVLQGAYHTLLTHNMPTQPILLNPALVRLCLYPAAAPQGAHHHKPRLPRAVHTTPVLSKRAFLLVLYQTLQLRFKVPTTHC
jgi:hypothetical protein